MNAKPGAVARGVEALTAAAVIVGGVAIATPSHAVLPVPTISAVSVAGGPATNKVVTAGTTIVITGTGFTGMTDNAVGAGTCSSNAPAAWPDADSGCSQVRFLGTGATSTANFTVATRYTVVSNTTIYATVPAMTVKDGDPGGPAAGTGSIRVQVLNTMPTGTSSLLSASTASELFYRKQLTATLADTAANPVGAGVVPVTVGVQSGGSIASLTSNTLPQEKITAYVYNTVAGSPQVAVAAIALKDATTLNITLPAGTPSGNFIGVTLVHDGIAGVADTTHLKYPAVISKIESCTTDVKPGSLTSSLPTCSGSANAPATGNADVMITGKGFTGATAWDWDGNITTAVSDPDPAQRVGVDPTCTVVSDTLAYCDLEIYTVPNPPVVSVRFTPADPDAGGPATAPALAPTGGGIIIYSTLV
jgi:hypothetical protein